MRAGHPRDRRGTPEQRRRGVQVKRTLQVIDEPLADDAKVVASLAARPRPVLRGGGRTTLLCGACGFPVARRIDAATVGGLVLRCPRCCRYNALPA
jgi:hypothetical protein